MERRLPSEVFFDYTRRQIFIKHFVLVYCRSSKLLPQSVIYSMHYLKRANEIFLFDVGVVKVDEFVHARELHLF